MPWGTRIAVKSRGRRWSGLLPMLRTLQQAPVGAGSVFVADAFAWDGQVDWQLPFSFAALPDDPLTDAFSDFRACWREPWPYRFCVVDRSHARVEMLVFSGSLRHVAGRLLMKEVRCRATLVLLLGGMEEDAGAEDVMRIVAHELSAEGVVCVTPPAAAEPDWGMQALVRLGDELTHDRPLDMALLMAFGEGVIAFLSRDLVQLSHLSNSVDRITGRLKALPPDATLVVSERSLDDLIRVPDLVEAWETAVSRGELAGCARTLPGA